jgi:hypothetical protein
MEIVGIILSVPAAFVCSMLYCLLLVKVILKLERLAYILRLLSIVVLALFVVEIVLLITLGSVRGREILGPGFYATHVALFFLGPPALANLLVLKPGPQPYRRWYVAALMCTGFAFCLVLLQYTVSESLYGIDGEGGPYSSSPRDTPIN